MPSGPKKRRAAKKKNEKEPNISKESLSQEKLKCLEDSNNVDQETCIPVLETVSVVDSSKPPITLSDDQKSKSGPPSSIDEYSNILEASLSEVKINNSEENEDLLVFSMDPNDEAKKLVAENNLDDAKPVSVNENEPNMPSEEVKFHKCSNEGDQDASIPVLETLVMVDSSEPAITLSEEKRIFGPPSSDEKYFNISEACLSIEFEEFLAFSLDPNVEEQKSVAENILDVAKPASVNENKQVLQLSNVSSEGIEDKTIQTSSVGTEQEHLLGTSQNYSESESANLDQMFLACPLHCSFNQWVGSKSKRVSTNEEKNAKIVCDKLVERVKKTVEKELQITDEMGALLRKLLDDFNAIQIPK